MTRNVKWSSYPDRGQLANTGQPVRVVEALANHVKPDPSWLRPPAENRSALRPARLKYPTDRSRPPFGSEEGGALLSRADDATTFCRLASTL